MRRITIVVGALMLGSYLFYQHSLPSAIVATCEGAQYKNSCYNEVIDTTLRTRGLAAAFDVLALAYNADPGYLSTCHAETHELGKAAYKEFHASGNVELTSKTSYCGYGFYHGFMDELVVETNDFDEARGFCAYVGKVVLNPVGYAEGACYHGIGHGVTDGTDPRLWGNAEALATPGLKLCARIAKGSSDHEYRCASGVFNAVALLYRDQKYKLNVDGNPFSLCEISTLISTEKEACYDQMNTLAMYAGEYDFARAINFTQNISELKYRTIAIRGIAGTYFSNTRSRHRAVSAEEVSEVCGKLGEDADACITGVVAGIQEFGTPGAEYKDMLAFCQSPDLDHALTATCYRAAISATQEFYGDTVVQHMCVSVPSAYQSAPCRI